MAAMRLLARGDGVHVLDDRARAARARISRAAALSSTTSTRSCASLLGNDLARALLRADAEPDREVKVLPTPGSLSSQMRPPMSSTSRRQIVSPRPVPPCLRVVDMSACVNGWNSFADCSARHADAGVAHGELELHLFAGAFEQFDARAGFRRCSVNLTALLTRLVRIWPSRSGSPSRCSGIARRDVGQELEPLVVRLLRGDRRDRADDVVEPEVGGFDVELAGLDLGEIEDVVDDASSDVPALWTLLT